VDHLRHQAQHLLSFEATRHGVADRNGASSPDDPGEGKGRPGFFDDHPLLTVALWCLAVPVGGVAVILLIGLL